MAGARCRSTQEARAERAEAEALRANAMALKLSRELERVRGLADGPPRQGAHEEDSDSAFGLAGGVRRYAGWGGRAALWAAPGCSGSAAGHCMRTQLRSCQSRGCRGCPSQPAAPVTIPSTNTRAWAWRSVRFVHRESGPRK